MPSFVKVWIILVALLSGAINLAQAKDDAIEAPRIKASDLVMSGDAKSFQIDVAMTGEPGMNWFLLRGPHRLVIDLDATQFIFEPEALKPNRMVDAVRFGNLDAKRSRLIFEMRGPFSVGEVNLQDPDPAGVRKLSINLKAANASEFDAALAEQQMSTAATGEVAVAKTAPLAKERFSIVLDPGHGGIDGGAKGVGGTSEKEITLSFAKELKAKLEATGRYDVTMTRDDDRFVRLDERVRFARSAHADLFISIHADTIRYKGVRGSTVYTVSDEASDAEAAELADRENLSDQVAGIAVEEENPEVADILVELIRRETHGFSVNFARQLVKNLSSVTAMIKNPHRHAGFRVLRAPDVPSVLLELGYLSNEKDEAQLLDPEWRGRMADTVVLAIGGFAERRVSAGQ